MSAPPDWADRIRRIHADAGGLLVLNVVRLCDAPDLIAAALAGDADAARLMHAVNNCLRLVKDAPAHAPVQCGCCRKPLRRGRYSFVVGQPAITRPADMLGWAVCERCGPTLGAIHAVAARALRDLWPDSRPITVTHANGGRA